MTNFNEPIDFSKKDIKTLFQNKELILKDIYPYDGPITLQALPYGGIQSVFHYHLIIFTFSGFIASDNVIYDGQAMTSYEFINRFPDLVNQVLPN